MAHAQIYEFDALAAAAPGVSDGEGLRTTTPQAFAWLEAQALRLAETGEAPWLRVSQRRGRRVVQATSFVGVIQAPEGDQIEVLPKIGKAIAGAEGAEAARQILIDMLSCLRKFRHIQTESAHLSARRMPLLEVWISEFLRAVEHLVKRGLRSDYTARQDNLVALRGKLQMAIHLRRNLCRRDRFFVEFDEFSANRPENRLVRAALQRVLIWTSAQTNQQLARELSFAFAEAPASAHPPTDFQRVRLDRGMAHYDGALAWARLILNDESPLTGAGGHHAPSLLFPMEKLFEAFVAKHLRHRLSRGFTLREQVRELSLVRHVEQDWFRLKPDLLVRESKSNRFVLDAKWKLIDGRQATRSQKYGLDQGDFYQLHAYGQTYLDGEGDVALIYPKTDAFDKPPPVFQFSKSPKLRLWALPFCLKTKRLILPECGALDAYFSQSRP